MAVILDQRPIISLNDVDLVAIDYTRYLDASELLTGTPTVASLGTVVFDDDVPTYAANSDLSFADIAVNTVARVIVGKMVAIGKAVQFKISGQKEDTMYGVRVTASTNSTPARTKVVDVIVTTAK